MRQRWVSVLICAAVSAAATTACGSGGASQTQDGKTELTIATFNEFGYEDLLKEYEAAHPDVKITQRKTGQGQPHHQNLFTKLGAGSGLADIEAIVREDPFVERGLADFRIVQFRASQRADDLPRRLE